MARSDSTTHRVRKPGQRRALSHVGGKTHFAGPRKDLEPLLVEALRVDSDEDSTRAHMHGFHSYPARLHPLTARRLIEGLCEPGAVVLDPFCGSGTVLLESCLAKRSALGSDVNPLALLLSRTKCESTSPGFRAQLMREQQRIVEFALERRKLEAAPLRRYGQADRQLFAPHVLLELDSLRAGVSKTSDPKLRAALNLVLSSVLTKVSQRAGDSSAREVSKRLASGFTIRMFADRTRELVRRMETYSRLVGRKRPRVQVFAADARSLSPISDASVDLVVSSPPYPGVFDYLEHHEQRLAWLGLRATQFAKAEIGARRQMSDLGPKAVRQWTADLVRVLASIERVLRPGGYACVVMADSVVSDKAVYADELLKDLLTQQRLELCAIASQKRPYFHRPTAAAFKRRPRQEHLMILQRPA